MRLLFLCKRRPQGRDLVESPYGRFYYLPALLARQGFEVRLALLNYHYREAELDFERDQMSWSSRSITRYLKQLTRTVYAWSPDWIIGLSDTWYGLLARFLAARCGARFAIDAYDNYESYMPWAVPLHWAWRRALADADLTIAAGPALAELMNAQRLEGASVVVPMAADPVGYIPLDKIVCRKSLALPLDIPLVGYCGAIAASRGIQQLFDAMLLLPEAKLVLSGRVGRGVQLPPQSIHLGYVPRQQLPLIYNALDVLAVVNRDSRFGRHSYPIKLYEAMACKTPCVASETPATRWILRQQKELLSPAGDSNRLADTLRATFSRQQINYGSQSDWKMGAKVLATAFITAKPTLDILPSLKRGDS